MSTLTLTPAQIAEEQDARSKVIGVRLSTALVREIGRPAHLVDRLLSTVETALERRLLEHGIRHPKLTIQAAGQVGIDLPSACANLIMETSGGLNEFGHDPGAWQGMYADRGFVTRPLYREYRRLVAAGESGLQGVGPGQLTSNTLQEEADHLGGCDVIVHNLHIDFLFLRQLQDEFGIEGGFQHYNGSGPAAVTYGQRAVEIRAGFQTVLS